MAPQSTKTVPKHGRDVFPESEYGFLYGLDKLRERRRGSSPSERTNEVERQLDGVESRAIRG
jgi:hypothetical protein